MSAEKLLSEGLQRGFAGGTIREGVDRAGFRMETSHFEDESGNIYHDEWDANRVGGGQELVSFEGKQYTRVYAGGTISEEELLKIGITKKDIMKFLKKQILENGEKIRLHSDFEPEAEGDWQYSYKVTDKNTQIPMTTGKEVISYKETLVFVHDFIICPVD